MPGYVNVFREYDASSVSELRNKPILVPHLTCVVKAISFYHEGCRLVKSMEKKHNNGCIRWFECDGGGCRWKAKFVKRGAAQEAVDPPPWYLHYEDSSLEHCSDCHAPKNEANETILTQRELLRNSVCLQEHLKKTGNSTKKRQIVSMLKREANVDISGMPRSTYYDARKDIADFIEQELTERSQHRDQLAEMETEEGDPSQQGGDRLFGNGSDCTSPTRSSTTQSTESASLADSTVHAAEAGLDRETQKHHTGYDYDRFETNVQASLCGTKRMSDSKPITLHGIPEFIATEDAGADPFVQVLNNISGGSNTSSTEVEGLDVHHLIHLWLYDWRLQSAQPATTIDNQVIANGAKAALSRNVSLDFRDCFDGRPTPPESPQPDNAFVDLVHEEPPNDLMDDSECFQDILMDDIEAEDMVVDDAGSNLHKTFALSDLDSVGSPVVPGDEQDATPTLQATPSAHTAQDNAYDEGKEVSPIQNAIGSDELGPPPLVATAAVSLAVGTPVTPDDGEDVTPTLRATSSVPRHWYKLDPPTEDQVKLDNAESAPIRVAPLFAVGTPVQSDDEEDYSSEIQTESSPPPLHAYGLDLSTKERNDDSVRLVAAEPVPPIRWEGPEKFTVGQTTSPKNTQQEGGQRELRLEKRNQSSADNPADDRNSRICMPSIKLAAVDVCELIVIVVIIVLGVVIGVLFIGNSDGGGGGSPDSISLPSGSPALAPSGNPPELSYTRRPAPDDLSSPPESPTVASQTLEVVVARGVLLCGVLPGLDGFSVLNEDTYVGFEADLCRSLAGAALGNADNVEFVEVEAEDMFAALQLGSVDVLASHVTHTTERDVFESSSKAGFTFSVPYLYDGITFGGLPTYTNCTDRLDTAGNCTSIRICALEGSTHASTVVELLGGQHLIRLPTMKSLYDAFDSGSCNVIAGDRFEVSEAVVRRNGYTGEYQVGEHLHSHEPLSMVTRDNDIGWSDMVQWVVQALLASEEQGIFMDTAESFATTDMFGDGFSTLFRNEISAVGNYGELYARHLESIVPRRRVNTINAGDSGLIFSFPFGSLTPNGQGPMEGGTLRRIMDRGHLRCGITRSPGFGEFDGTTGIWSGLDVDFCRAVSAAIFNGVPEDVDFQVLAAPERFIALADGLVDVHSQTTWTFERDVREPTSGVGFSFSQPSFYDGLAIGGIPTYVQCAEILDASSTVCRGLKLCVVDGTTAILTALAYFSESVVVPQANDLFVGLSNGACNVIVGQGLQIAEPHVRDHGYTGPYEIGKRRFSKDPRSAVTRQDDPQFTSFVNLIVSATFYAEEQGITQSTGHQMPLVSLFGPLHEHMLIDAIQAVGNYGEIYARNVEPLVPRAGLNALNRNPFGPQHYPLPGI